MLCFSSEPAGSSTCRGRGDLWVILDGKNTAYYIPSMKAVITTKGQVTIPHRIRRRLNLKPGQILEFDERTPFVKATKAVDVERMRSVIGMFKKELAGKSTKQWLEMTRGPVELAPGDK